MQFEDDISDFCSLIKPNEGTMCTQNTQLGCGNCLPGIQIMQAAFKVVRKRTSQHCINIVFVLFAKALLNVMATIAYNRIVNRKNVHSTQVLIRCGTSPIK